jgi:hypothetical protein
MISGRAELAKEEYATTWQEEGKVHPQAQRRGKPQGNCGAHDEEQRAFPRKRITEDSITQEDSITEDRRSKNGFSQGRRETDCHEDSAQREAGDCRP